MKASGKTMRRAPRRAASAARSAAFSRVRSRSKATEAACTTAARAGEDGIIGLSLPEHGGETQDARGPVASYRQESGTGVKRQRCGWRRVLQPVLSGLTKVMDHSGSQDAADS